MNHIDTFETITSNMELSYEIRSMIRNLHNMKMSEMLAAKDLMNLFVDKKHNDYMLIFNHENEG